MFISNGDINLSINFRIRFIVKLNHSPLILIEDVVFNVVYIFWHLKFII